jgi:outer membrane protein
VKKWHVTTAALLLAVSPLQAETLTLGAAMRMALERNPSVLRSRSDIERAEALVRETRSAILPQLSVDSRYTRNDREVAFELDGASVPVLPRDDWSASIRLAQPVYAGGRELKAIRQIRLTVDEREEASRQAEESLLLDVASSYLNVIGADALILVEQQNLELSERQRKQSQDFFDAGEVTRVDVLRAETASKGAERRLAAARQTRENAASLLRLSLGDDVAVETVRPDLELPALPSEEELIARAEERRPEVQRAKLALEIAQLETRKQRGAYLPTVTAEASYTQQAAAFPSDQFGALTFNFNVPLYTSGRIPSRIAQAKEEENQARLVYDEARQAVREDVRRALVAFRTAQTDLALAEEQRIAAEAEYQQTFELYRSQEATSLDVQTAESSLASARRAVVIGNLDRDLAALRVWFSAGVLRSVVLEDLQ